MTKALSSIPLGNWLSIIATLISIGGYIWLGSAALTELRAADKAQEARIERIEKEVERAKTDHDAIIEIRGEVKLVRQLVEQLAGRRN